MSDSFLDVAEVRLRELRERDRHLEDTARGIEEQRKALKADIERLQAAIDLYTEMMGLPPRETPKEQTALAFGQLKDMTIADACESIMRAQGGEANVTMLVRTLSQAGKLKESRGAYGTIVNTLKRFPNRFHKAKPGQWRLVQHSENREWKEMVR